MQRTRLSTLAIVTGNRLNQFFTNPWRRISLILLGFLGGIFVGQGVSLTSGQKAYSDVIVAAFVLLFTETVSRFTYSRQHVQKGRSLWLDVLNFFKIGITYSLFLDAFKLGS